MDEINVAYEEIRHTPEFQNELADLFANYVYCPSPLFYAKRLSEQLGGAQIYLKREDLNHTGAHKINHCLGDTYLLSIWAKESHCRNGCGSAWGGFSNGLCFSWYSM